MAATTAARERASGDEAIAKVFAHPLRVRLLQLLVESPASPNELASRLDEPLANVAYHVRELAKYECIELVDTKQRRGATEHFYRAISRPAIGTREWSKLSHEERRSTSRFGAQMILADLIAADVADTFDSRVDRHFSRCPGVFDQRAWEKVSRACDDFMELVLAAQEESANRIAAEPGTPTVSAVATLLFFEQAPAPR
ncbi:MAG: helix-turn-helix domain-containing protein [Solirubrobacterales bacterium]